MSEVRTIDYTYKSDDDAWPLDLKARADDVAREHARATTDAERAAAIEKGADLLAEKERRTALRKAFRSPGKMGLAL